MRSMIRYVALDVHKEKIVIAVAEKGGGAHRRPAQIVHREAGKVRAGQHVEGERSGLETSGAGRILEGGERL